MKTNEGICFEKIDIHYFKDWIEPSTYPNVGGAAWLLLFERLNESGSTPRQFFLLSGIFDFVLLILLLEMMELALILFKSHSEDLTMLRPRGVAAEVERVGVKLNLAAAVIEDVEGGGRGGGGEDQSPGGISTISFKVKF